MLGKGSRFMFICVAAFCIALLAMRLGQSREPDLSFRTDAPDELIYVGTTDYLAYHHPSCREVEKAGTDKLITFLNAKQAAQQGYHQCAACMP